MGITANKNRIGAFTSSEIYRLMGTDKVAKTYIDEKRFELKLKRSLDVEASTKPMNWGLALEQYVHDNYLDLGYELNSNVTLTHGKYPFWAGSTDNVNKTDEVVCDTKCLQPKKFCEVVDCLTECVKLGNLNLFKEEHKDKYWQLVSNACILRSLGTKISYIEPIIFMPYESELDAIRQFVENNDWEEPWKFRFITESTKEELAYLPDDSEYKNINLFRFKLDESDCIKLDSKVIEAGILLTKK